jgi:hypothetical protein
MKEFVVIGILYCGAHGQNAAFLPFAEGDFATASGKAEFYSEALRARGLDPVAAFTPPRGIAARGGIEVGLSA